jgi:hypothetical protein
VIGDGIEGVSRSSRGGKTVSAELLSQPDIQVLDLGSVQAAGFAGSQVGAESIRFDGF